MISFAVKLSDGRQFEASAREPLAGGRLKKMMLRYRLSVDPVSAVCAG